MVFGEEERRAGGWCKGLLLDADRHKRHMCIGKHKLRRIMGSKDRVQRQWGWSRCRRSQTFWLNWGRWEELLVGFLRFVGGRLRV